MEFDSWWIRGLFGTALPFKQLSSIHPSSPNFSPEFLSYDLAPFISVENISQGYVSGTFLRKRKPPLSLFSRERKTSLQTRRDSKMTNQNQFLDNDEEFCNNCTVV
eukprot:TRINITY_DN25632_c0_g2_i1.p3 TRINITY_DN25632_c0_g2~~TRINITY_DN25632_c0_g2_i1.p3  ORF type:complete len:106 (-),score=24.66 TRINITY_DN25632_c0_g2_i1:256-573(-)